MEESKRAMFQLASGESRARLDMCVTNVNEDTERQVWEIISRAWKEIKALEELAADEQPQEN
jgi:hypothetical protein